MTNRSRTSRPAPSAHCGDRRLAAGTSQASAAGAGRGLCRRLHLLVLLVPAALLAALPAVGSEKGEVRYNRDVLPILAEHCFACHGPDRDGRKGGLQLHRREEAVAPRDADGHHAIRPGDAEGSLVLARVVATDPQDRMPPVESGPALSEREIDILRRWIDQGAAYEPHWAFVPPAPVEPPTVSADAGSPPHPVDRFVRHRLETEGVAPAPEADRVTLLRRLSLDLTGLPPMPAEAEAFLADTGPGAYDRLVERLLGSVHFGEKWARWWLDLAHYADSDGIRLDRDRPHAWRYRQWVVEALNADLPFDRFTLEQLAGDLLPGAGESQLVATGFLRNTVSDRQTGNADPALGRVRQIVDRTATVGSVWLGLTMDCAECHDHKFDPLSQEDFFRLYAFFDRAEERNIDAPLPGELEARESARRDYERERAGLLAPVAERLADLQAEWEEKMRWIEENPGADHAWARAYELLVTQWGIRRGEGQFEGITLIKTPPSQRTPDEEERLQDFFLKNGRVVAPEEFEQLKIPELSRQLEALARQVPPISRAQAIAELPFPVETHIHERGDFRRPGARVSPGTPAVLPPLEVSGETGPTRIDLARWLVSPEQPLTARVTVNRLWQELFGTGLVATSENLGVRGALPSHPELLDWLAAEFPARGWSLKEMIRLMVSSETYRQSSRARPELVESDPGNALLARQVPLRLSAEGIRDQALAVGGLLDLTVGGPSVRPPQPESFTRENTRNPWRADEDGSHYRRGLYVYLQRLTPFAQFANFDLPGSTTPCSRRERSNTPLQALNLLNDPTFVEAAQGLASRVWEETAAAGPGAQSAQSGQGDGRGAEEARLGRAFLVALARDPAPQESERLLRHLDVEEARFSSDPEAAALLAPNPFPGAGPARSAAWVSLASVLLNLHEFLHRE